MSKRRYLGDTKKFKKSKLGSENLQNVQISYVGLSYCALSNGVGPEKKGGDSIAIWYTERKKVLVSMLSDTFIILYNFYISHIYENAKKLSSEV
jgi:hypothetical protein